MRKDVDTRFVKTDEGKGKSPVFQAGEQLKIDEELLESKDGNGVLLFKVEIFYRKGEGIRIGGDFFYCELPMQFLGSKLDQLLLNQIREEEEARCGVENEDPNENNEDFAQKNLA
jgi:hypothetical protein